MSARFDRLAAALLCGVFFLSGAAALSFETLWFRQAGLALGNTVWASSIVLAGFMSGLALGNALAARFGPRLARPVRAYAGLEALIALSGTVLSFLLPALGGLLAPLFRPLLAHPALLNALRLFVAFALLVLPATAMGATLPLLTRALHARLPGFGRVLGRLYGWNTLGAVCGALGGELLLVAQLGVPGAALCAGALALSAAGGAALLAPRLDGSAEASPQRAPRASVLGAESRRLLGAAFLCGACLLGLEVLWFRFLVLFVSGTQVAFAAMLAVVLLGIALGGFAGSWLLRLRPEAGRAFPAWAAAAGVLTVLAYGAFQPAAAIERGAAFASLRAPLLLSFSLMFPVCCVSGLLFTLLGARLHAAGGEAGPGAAARSAGLLTLANTAGGVLGSVAAGFLLLPGLGIEASIGLAAGLYGLVAWLGRAPVPAARGGRLALAGGLAALGAALLFFPRGALASRHLPHSSRRYEDVEGSRLVAYREGVDGTYRYLERSFLGRPLDHRLLTNAASMSGTQLGSRRYMKLYVYLPAALHPRLERALLIGFGVGQTAKALRDTASLTRIDVVDPSREVVELSRVVFPDPAEHPLEDPRVRVHREDGRFFLQASAERYDLITGEPPPPKLSGVVSLYTRDHFALMRARLREGGIASYWLPGLSLSGADAKAIVRAFGEVFPDYTLWQGWGLNLMLLGTRGGTPERPGLARVDPEQFAAQWADPRVGPELRALGLERPEQLGALYLMGPAALDALVQDVETLDDAHPHRLAPRPVDPDRAWRELSPWLDTERGRAEFAASPWIAALWPAALREASLADFAHQARINACPALMGGGPATPRRLDPVLRGSSLRTLVLWLLASDDYHQHIASAVLAEGGRGPLLDYHLGARALAERRYADAARVWARAQREDPRHRLRLLRAYAHCLVGDLAAARTLRAEARPAPDDREWDWLVQSFGL